jgi:transposase
VTNIDDIELVVGVDTHRDSHTAAICDQRGRPLAELCVPTTPEGYTDLLTWVQEAVDGGRVVWAVEGTRHYGVGLCRFLSTQAQTVVEIGNNSHIGKRRAGKSDPIDAVRAAKELLARPEQTETRADGDREALRLLMIDRDNVVDSMRATRAVLTSLIVTSPAGLREELRHLSRDPRARACAQLASPAGADRQIRVLHQTLSRVGQRIVESSQVVAELEAQITEIVEDLAPGVVAAEHGLGALSLAQILLSWSHAGRLRSEAAFAMLSGTAPIPVSSGRTDRHRLNRLGDRQLNRALHIVAVTRMRSHPATLAYVERRRAEGKTDKEIRRCIKRYLARHLFRTLNGLDRT